MRYNKLRVARHQQSPTMQHDVLGMIIKQCLQCRAQVSIKLFKFKHFLMHTHKQSVCSSHRMSQSNRINRNSGLEIIL